jgi:hypothetical protein
MKPIDQTTFGKGDGNCMAACVASVLEIPLEEIPDIRGDRQYAVLAVWLASRGLGMLSLGFDKPLPTDCKGAWPWGTGFTIMGGKSPRGDFEHAVIGHHGRMVHDPHPSRAGIENITSIDFITIGFDGEHVEKLRATL